MLILNDPITNTRFTSLEADFRGQFIYFLRDQTESVSRPEKNLQEKYEFVKPVIKKYSEYNISRIL
jgi:hypothetical protein